MGRFRLLLATMLAEWGGPLAIALLVAFALAFCAGVAFVASVLPVSFGSRVAFFANFFALFILSYALLVGRTARALRRPPLKNFAQRLRRDDANVLYALADDVARSIELSPPTAIWLGAGFDCTARAGRGGYELVLGLPLLDVLTAEQLRARIAVTLASSFGGDNLSARGYRLVLSWSEVWRAATAGSGAGVLARAIASICLIQFKPAMLEGRERYAREQARRHWSETVLASALARPAVYELAADESFWPQLIGRHVLNEQPPDAIAQLRAVCRAPLPVAESGRYFERVAPALRLDASLTPDMFPDAWRPAADVIPEPVLRDATARFDAAWRLGVSAVWAEASRVAHAQEAELSELDRDLATRELTDDEAWHRIELIEQRRGGAAALPLYRDWLERRPHDGRAWFHAGRHALDARADDGIALLQRAMELDDRFEADACALIGTELAAQGRTEDAQAYFERHAEANTRIGAALAARVTKLDPARSRAHGFAQHGLAALTEHLARFPMIKRAWLSRLEVEQLPTVPCMIVVIEFRRTWSWLHGDKKDGVLAAVAGAPLPLQIVAVQKGLRRRGFTRAPAALIYTGAVEPRSVRLARWGRRAQRVLVGAGILLVLLTGVQYRDCFPGCWEDVSAILVLGPMILAVNVLLLTGTPDTPRQRGVAFAASAFFAGMFFFGSLVPFVPVAVAGFLRAPSTRRAATWAVGLSVPAFVLGWMVTVV